MTLTEDVVSNHEPEEAGGLADCPWLSPSLSVDIVPSLDGDDIGGSEEKRPLVLERPVEELLGDGEGSSTEDGGGVNRGKRESCRVVSREIPDSEVGGEGELDGNHCRRISWTTGTARFLETRQSLRILAPRIPKNDGRDFKGPTYRLKGDYR